MLIKRKPPSNHIGWSTRMIKGHLIHGLGAGPSTCLIHVLQALNLASSLYELLLDPTLSHVKG